MKKLSLLARFSLLSLLLFIAIGAALGFGLTQYFEQQELERQKDVVASLLQPSVAPFVDEDVLANGAHGKKYSDIEYAFSYLAGVGLVRIKIWNQSGMVVYSDDPALVGKRFDKSADLNDSLAGSTTADISPLTKAENVAERGYGELLEVYAPLRLSGKNDVRGAFEGYFTIDELRTLLDDTNAFIWKVVAGGFLFLYVSLFAIVRGASQRLVTQSRENAMLLVDTQRKAARLETVNELARSINQSSLDLDMVFQTALRGIGRMAQHDGAIITLLDEHTGDTTRRIVSSTTAPDAQPLAVIAPDMEKQLLGKSEIVLCIDTRHYNGPAVDLLIRQGIRSFLVLSIYLGDRRLGTLLVVSRQPGAFDEDLAARLKGVADQLAVAIENVRLIKETAETTALRETNRLKDEFVSMVSHELRTPLASIKGYSHTLMSGDGQWDETTRREFLSIISDESDKLTDLVENVLEMSRIGAGRLPVTAEPILLSRYCKGVIDRVAKHYPEVRFSCELDDPLPVVEADPRRVEQVLMNLLHNAAKYSGADEVRVEGKYDGGSEVVICVRDQGKGIPPEHIPYVFDKFYRIETASNGNGKEAGTGLGLAICKALVEAQGGRIWVESKPGEGAAFFFTLPALALQGEGKELRDKNKERLSTRAAPGTR